jgi:hypothetical protein
METFGYITSRKIHRCLDCLWPLGGLAVIVYFELGIVEPSHGFWQLAGWVPWAFIFLIGWAIFEVASLWKALTFSVRLSEQSICVGRNEVKWADIKKVDLNRPPFVLHTISGTTLQIPVWTSNLPYIKTFVASHTKDLPR